MGAHFVQKPPEGDALNIYNFNLRTTNIFLINTSTNTLYTIIQSNNISLLMLNKYDKIQGTSRCRVVVRLIKNSIKMSQSKPYQPRIVHLLCSSQTSIKTCGKMLQSFLETTIMISNFLHSSIQMQVGNTQLANTGKLM